MKYITKLTRGADIRHFPDYVAAVAARTIVPPRVAVEAPAVAWLIVEEGLHTLLVAIGRLAVAPVLVGRVHVCGTEWARAVNPVVVLQ